jgi:hypothetical protein
MKNISLTALILAIVTLSPVNSQAQSFLKQSSSSQQRTTTIHESLLNRGINLARQAAEKANGGLSQYRAQSSMYGPSANAPFVENSDGTLTYTFVGGKPGESPTIESVITVNPRTGETNVDYNGPIRSQSTQPTTNVYDTNTNEANLNRARNLARQAAEKANGGLSQYRAESSMYGDISQVPFVENPDGTLSFNFVGGKPGESPTIESAVTVDLKTGQTNLDYNGPIRPQP